MNALSAYLSRKSIKQAEFALKVGLSQATISRLASGTLSPSLAVAVRIDRETQGAVPPSSWVEQSKIDPSTTAA
ncbi:helix-turn-helix transcriptional regulator [Salipiger sp. PrR003]|uniref:helix-turn-helix transcriptional regulator n=1 Tax=Salipiger sp. PrR003 TaxID=2706776 RepID=UPI0013DC66A2|nr:helix-turn-helix transcriptional regulator [Salipiger sp. PrR003]